MGSPISPPQVTLLDVVFASGLVKDYSLAIDGGANEGVWTNRLRERFDKVHAIDASLECVKILDERFQYDCRVEVTYAALMSEPGRVRVISPNRKPACQKRYVEIDSAGDTLAITIDNLCLPSCGLIKLDLEGAEGLALLGARATINRFKPMLIVEFFREYSQRYGHTEDNVLAIVKSMGYHEVFSSFPNKVFSHAN